MQKWRNAVLNWFWDQVRKYLILSETVLSMAVNFFLRLYLLNFYFCSSFSKYLLLLILGKGSCAQWVVRLLLPTILFGKLSTNKNRKKSEMS